MRFLRLTFAALFAAAPVAAQHGDTAVRAATRPMHAGIAELRPELRIGVVDGDENYMLGAIHDIAVAANGTMFVLDRSVPVVRVYDAGGKFIRNVGRRGRGPGEYTYAAGIAMGRNGNLLVYDIANARINVYSASGENITSWPTHSGGGTGSGRGIFIVDTTGTMYLRTPMWRTDGGVPPWAWIRIGADGKLRDTTHGPAMPPDDVLVARSERSSKTMGVPFAPANYKLVSPLGYFVTAQSSRLAIDLHEPNKAIASVRRDIAPQPVTGRERDSARAEVITSMRGTDPSWSWNGAGIPKSKAAFTGLRVGADGLLWVELSKGPRLNDGAGAGPGQPMGGLSAGRGPGRGTTPGWPCPSEGWSVHDVYEPSGAYRGQVRLPEQISPIVLRGDYVWAATCNEDDAPQVVRYRIVWR
jgi:hypothetical protein